MGIVKGTRLKAACCRGHINPPRSKYGACIPCGKEYRREKYLSNKDKIKSRSAQWAKDNPEASRDIGRAKRIGVPVRDIRSVITRSAGRCESCGLELTHEKSCVDHCHITGKIRGVLCRFCNALEGMLNKQPERVRKLIDYLDKFGHNSDQVAQYREMVGLAA